jgi:hypothetical protein
VICVYVNTTWNGQGALAVGSVLGTTATSDAAELIQPDAEQNTVAKEGFTVIETVNLPLLTQ